MKSTKISPALVGALGVPAMALPEAVQFQEAAALAGAPAASAASGANVMVTFCARPRLS